MKKTCSLILAAAALIASTALVTSNVIQASPQSQEEKQKYQEMMDLYMKLAKPGEQHKQLAKQLGDWKVATTMKGMDGKEEKSDASANFKSLLDGRFVMMQQKGTMGGMPFNGIHIVGYDNLHKCYCSVWLDNWSTGIHTATGQSNDKGEVEMKGMMKDAMTPKGRPFRTVMIPNADGAGFKVEVYDTHDGNEMKVLESVYSRAP